MRMDALLFVCFTLLAIFAVSTPAYCQNDYGVVEGLTFDGSVVSVDAQNSQIVIKANETMTFSVPSGAKIVNRDGFNMQLSDVNTGHYATVDYHNDKAGNHIVDGMEIEYNR